MNTINPLYDYDGNLIGAEIQEILTQAEACRRYPLYQLRGGSVTQVPEPPPPDLDERLREILDDWGANVSTGFGGTADREEIVQRIKALFGRA